jgi:3-oxoacyl-[acyl-carrier-protein] synthase-3
MGAIPELVEQVLRGANCRMEDIHLFLMHQATLKMLQQLQERLSVDAARVPLALKNVGNTVSSTIPILIDQLRREGKLERGTKNMMIGFGVGWSWAGCIWRDVWSA